MRVSYNIQSQEPLSVSAPEPSQAPSTHDLKQALKARDQGGLTWYISGISNSTFVCSAPNSIISQNGAYICGDFSLTATAGGGFSTSCVELTKGKPGNGVQTCVDNNCIACNDNYCNTHYLQTASTARPLSQLFCGDVPNYVETMYTTPFLNFLESTTTATDLPSAITASVSQSVLPAIPTAATASPATPSCLSPANQATLPAGTMAAIAVPSILGTLLIACAVFFFILKSQEKKYAKVSSFPGISLDTPENKPAIVDDRHWELPS